MPHNCEQKMNLVVTKNRSRKNHLVSWNKFQAFMHDEYVMLKTTYVVVEVSRHSCAETLPS